MYLAGGHAYVYRIYGIHFCLNVVTGRRAGEGIAVLLRAGEILEGEELVRRNRPGAIPAHRLLAGPGNLTRGLAVDRDLDAVAARPRRTSVGGGEAGRGVERSLTGPRVGCESAGEAAAWPLRYAIARQPGRLLPAADGVVRSYCISSRMWPALRSFQTASWASRGFIELMLMIDFRS